MIVSNCPRCHEAFRVPAGELPADAYAQCPWCRETFPVAEMLKVLPPVVQLMTADGEPMTPARPEAAAIGIASQSDSSPGLEVVQSDAEFLPDPVASSDAETVFEDATAESFKFDEPESQAAEAVDDESWGETALESEYAGSAWGGDQPSVSQGEFEAMSLSPARTRKRSGGGIGTAIKVVLGGVLAVPIAGGILMAFGRTPDWGFWPFNGPGDSTRPVAAAPADVSSGRDQPARAQDFPVGRTLNPNFEDDTLSVAPAEMAREQLLTEPKVADMSVDQQPDPTLVDPPTADPPTADSPMVMPEANELADAEPSLADRIQEEDPVVDATSTAPGLEMPSVSGDREFDSPTEEPIAEAPSAEPDADRPIPAVEAPPAEEAPALIAVADRAGKMVEALSTYEGDPQERIRRMLMTYERIAEACDLATSESRALNRLASQIKNSSLLDEIGGMASEWLAYKSRKSEGIVVVGQANSDGEGQTIKLDSGKVLSVVGDVQIPAAERVLAMGRIIDENSVELLLTQPSP